MPWDVKKKDDKFCVYKKGSGTPIKGGCHDTRAEAVKHQKALYAAEAMSEVVFTIHAFSDSVPVIVSGEPTWVHANTFGETDHPIYGEQTWDEDTFQRMIDNYTNGVYGQKLPINYEHFGMDQSKGFKAAGWVEDVKVKEDGLWYLVDWTETAAKEINEGAWKYFSFEWYDLWENEKGEAYTDVLVGGALTNQPYRKGMVPLNGMSENYPGSVGVLELEHADLEHAEPGTGNPPERREDSDIDVSEQHRREQVPPAFEEPEDSVVDKEENMEFLVELRKKLGLSENATEDELLAKVSELDSELEPLRKADEEASKRKGFREAFPDEWERMQSLTASDREAKAGAFSSSYTRFLEKADGDEVVKSNKGFSALVLDKIREGHVAMSQGAFSEEHLKGILDHISAGGIVEYSEKGTAILEDDGKPAKVANAATPRHAFSERVKALMEEDNLDRSAAITEAAKRWPDEYAAYRTPVVS